jgi:hypothetical protein
MTGNDEDIEIGAVAGLGVWARNKATGASTLISGAHEECAACRTHARREVSKHRFCIECGTEVLDYYALDDDIWTAVAGEPDAGALHLGCVEKRLGRRLTVEDFKRVATNSTVFFAAGMARVGSDKK